MARMNGSDQLKSIVWAMYNHREEEDLIYRTIGQYCIPKLTESQVKNSMYDFRSHFQDQERQVRSAVKVAGRLGKKGRKLIG